MDQKIQPMRTLKVTIFTRVMEILFLAVVATSLYLILTLNLQGIIFITLVIILQSFWKGRYYPYINFISNILEIPRHFQITREYEENVPEEQKTLFSFQPHSVYSFCVLLNLNHPDYPNEKMSRMVGLSSRFMLSLPVLGLLFRFWGLESVDPVNLKQLMRKGKTIGLVPGGYEEATLTSQREMRFFLKNRKGFIKYALKYGYTIRPVIAMNEHKAFWTMEGGLKWRLLMNKIKLPGVVFCSNYGIFYPPNIEMKTIIGKAIHPLRQYTSSEEPTSEQIQKVHGIYLKEVEELYERHKEKNGGVPLKIY